MEKAAVVEGELPKAGAEAIPSALPGWGMWAGSQREPRWMKDARDKAERQVEGGLNRLGNDRSIEGLDPEKTLFHPPMQLSS